MSSISYISIWIFPLMLSARSRFNGTTLICSNFTNLLYDKSRYVKFDKFWKAPFVTFAKRLRDRSVDIKKDEKSCHIHARTKIQWNKKQNNRSETAIECVINALSSVSKFIFGVSRRIFIGYLNILVPFGPRTNCRLPQTICFRLVLFLSVVVRPWIRPSLNILAKMIF